MTEPFRLYIVPAKWWAFIPADACRTSEWLDLHEVRGFTKSETGSHPLVVITWKDGSEQKFFGDRANHMDQQFTLFRSQQEAKFPKITEKPT